jgi:hypothetical protein
MSSPLRTLVSVPLALTLLAALATAQDNSPEKAPSAPPKISYVGGQLKIDASGATLADVLTKVAALTGVNIEIPPGASSERMPFVELGPGPARQIIASLLSDSNFDYLIQASDADPDKVQSVLLLARDKKGGVTNTTEVAARPTRSPYSKQPEGAASDAPAQPGTAVAEVNAAAPAATPDQSATPPPDQPMRLSLSQADQNLLKSGQLSPPQSLTPQSINQQLQQMYQQRVQINQQLQSVAPVPRQQ